MKTHPVSQALIVIVLLWLLSACGTATLVSDGAVPVAPSNDGIVEWPLCTPALVKTIEVPNNFAPNFPFPWGMRLYQLTNLSSDPNHTQIQLVGLAPMSVPAAANYLHKQLPRTGYRFGFLEAEEGEAEAQFHGNSWTGSYAVNSVPECAAISLWTIKVSKMTR